MAFGARILADSRSPDGVRLTTFEVTIPRIVLAEFNTHRMLSRNSASSRAIPVPKMLEKVIWDPYIPTAWGKNKKGMQADKEVPGSKQTAALAEWLKARDEAVSQARALLEIGIHKQITNRLLEPFMWHTIIVTATEWDNFFHLRNNADAHPDIAVPASMMQELYEELEPQAVDYGGYHLPLIDESDELWADHEVAASKDSGKPLWRFSAGVQKLLAKVSVGRCARVPYLTHEGKRDPQADIALCERLLQAGHMSPFENVARPMLRWGDAERWSVTDVDLEVDDLGDIDVRPEHRWSGNFRGWVQYRKTIEGESDILGHRQQTETFRP